MLHYFHFLLGAALGLGAPASRALEPCRIEVVEKSSGWPVALVELRTTHHLRFVTDNAGVIALDAPELMGRETWFTIHSPGYEVRRDGFGIRGVRLLPEPGARLQVTVQRTSIARRLGRLTGAGLFAESRKLGEQADWKETGVFGCDSVQTAVHRGKLHWAWGDTTLAHYPLGVFHMTGTVTDRQPLRSFEPPLKVPFEVFQDERGRPRGLAPMPGSGPTWLSGFVSLPDRTGTPRLVGTYIKVKPPLEAYQSGLCVWNEGREVFEPLKIVWNKDAAHPVKPLTPDGHPIFWTDEQGKEWILFGDPFPRLKCPATFEAWQDPAQWQPLEAPAPPRSAADDTPVKPHTGSIAWNAFRKRWVTVFMQAFGKPSAFGELWYAEADSPFGPWGPAVKVLSHDDYTFYNPRLHPEFTVPDSPILIFEGTYTRQFSGAKEPTPRYDYNQLLYRLDLDDPALAAARR